MAAGLLESMENSDLPTVSGILNSGSFKGEDAWETHLSLFPMVQRVLNPPYINPHLPKMYSVIRDLLPYITDIAPLVRLEITEYTRRPKLEPIPKPSEHHDSITVDDILTSIMEREPQRAAAFMSAFNEENGGAQFARQMLLIGSAYLDRTLGHSVSCTAFILLEMLQRPDEDPWPATATLADYFCKGQFHTLPDLMPESDIPEREAMLMATAGDGIVNLHHSITRYAIERVRHLLSNKEYLHMLSSWTRWMGSKQADSVAVLRAPAATTYEEFREAVAVGDAQKAISTLVALLPLESGPSASNKMGHYLTSAVCDLYLGDYDPHFLNGLGSLLWIAEYYSEDPEIVAHAIGQYLRYFMNGRRT